jgi:hypothetical protein
VQIFGSIYVAASFIDKQTRFLTEWTPMKLTASPIPVIFSLVCVGFLSKAEAVSPPPDGGYTGANTAEGQSALLA